nr:1-phosphatidylinositol 4,5-bisphosphate phosphodiesterase eta-1 isoform X1 [Pelodiscus sinensis]XP_014429301.1 1-phosphatidylinositol 4,5-bisphosphate phosphodiesterase eta-1 isoform X1 [Pelodiscus sinensis]XP_025040650.1 1-phosphatidylinositol 4,5-bisphosphate phosphodiesterase eta-1 isoform X1 [Pelodiscus sinensis]XP_025040651.1 1-phosphatidylinositol 4,5-bisphosphate phosphodiesterase eta-1 isoform X1 [Pelodiscus sinensis]|eukprot:XP_006123543.1 1-phosphatidylinositol 4,5-bisphosphate phosphodiesterase eta-1 isoform X1 [Pelodiscus sinensis]
MSYWSLDKKSCLQYCRHFLVDNGVFHVERCMSVMQSGTQMIKLKSGTKGLVRLFYLDEHRTCIRWRPSRKSEKAKIVIDSIYKVTEGRQSEIFHRHTEGNFDPSCCFTIYHGNHMESLDLITSNPEEARTWITGLKYLMAGISDEDSLAKRQRTHDHWVKQTFEEADKNGDGLLNIEEIHQLMHKLNVNLPRRKVRQMFQEADTDENQGTLTFEEFSVFYKMMSLRRDLYLLLLSYSDKKDHLTVEEFAQFLKVEQKMNNVTIEYCLDIIRKFEVSEENKEQNVLGIEGFTSFMRSSACDIFNPLHSEVHQDMDQPLCNYYIASSHNTYLTGDQLLSQSKVEMYARVLQDGCRCIEVDCWDGPDGEPVVHHGYTLTSKILFRDVVEAINKNAFVKNEFPVILSIENHCSIQQQKKIAQYLKEIFSDKLDLSSIITGDSKQLPSPQSLKGKILVKGKKLPYNLASDAEEGEVSDEDSADEIEDDCKLKLCYSNGTTEHQMESFIRKKLESLIKESQIRDKEDPDSFTVRALLKATHEGLNVNLKQNRDTKESGKKSHSRSLIGNFGKHKKAVKPRSKSHSTSDDEESQQNSSGKEIGQLYRLGRRRKTMKLCRALSDLVVYTNSVAAQDIVDDGTMGNVLSFSETRAHQIVQQKSEHFILYNQKQLTRIYPSAYRIDSSNFNPMPYWNAGCQLVALNYQSDGRMMQVNQAKFRMNGNCGYVLKPQQMCKGTFNPYCGDPLPANPKKQLILKVISGQQLPKPPDSVLGDRGEIIDPFVEVEVIGLPVDCCKDQTRVVDDNGFNPVWEETLTFTIHMPEIALVRFLVWDHDPIGRDFVGQRTVAFSSLVPGYRHVYLEGLTEASIFVHITINEIYGKNRQLIGLKGLFNKNPKHNSAESNGYSVRKRSIGDRILRRTASAPAKGRKKSKMGFQEATEIKDGTPEPTDVKDKEGVIRRTTRSLQARPASMPVDKFLLVGLSSPEREGIKDTKRKENTSDSNNGTSETQGNLKEHIFSSPEQAAPSSNSTSLPKKATSQSDTRIGSSVESPVHEHGESFNFVTGIAETSHSTECQESHLSNEPVHIRHGSVVDLGTEKIHDTNYTDEKRGETGGYKEEKKILAGSCLSQKEQEFENNKYDVIMNSTIATFSLTDVSSIACSDIQDLPSTAALQDSDVSRLIDEVTLTNESEISSSVSALIGQFDVTDDQSNLTSLHGASNQTFNAVSAHPHKLTVDLSTPLKQNFTNVTSVESQLFSTPNTAMFSSPETTEYSMYTIVHEASLSPASDCKPIAQRACKKSDCVENSLPVSQCISPLHLLTANPKRKCGTNWETLEDSSSCTSNSGTLEDTIVVPPAFVNSAGSSLMEVEGDSQDLLITAYEFKREDLSQLAASLKLKHNQDSVYYCERISGNNLINEDLHNAAVDNSDNFRTARNQSFPYPAFQSVGFLHNNYLQASDMQNDLLYVSQRSRLNMHSPTPKNSLPYPPATAIKQPSPCKSKSLGDLTSEDISCNFESKYKYISRSFITSGMRDKKVAAMKTQRPQSTDTLTEQLRKLVSFDQEDNCQTLYSKQNDDDDDDDCPKALVRKLSSRSQSRVRNIASRAKERQEANKQKLSNATSIAGVVLRNKPSVSAHVINRHSTGSYIARYLNNFSGEDLEGRGAPEGSCTSLQYGCNDQFCRDDSVFQMEPSSDDKPEIYFLLRL